jgi:hypothetical protein
MNNLTNVTAISNTANTTFPPFVWVFPTAYVDAFDIIYATAIVLLFIFYIFIVIVLIINRNVTPFNSTFFALWINLAAINACACALVWLFFKTSSRLWWPWSFVYVNL